MQMYFDTIVHSVAALQYLVRVVGADRVVIGTDYPMAMGDFDPVNKVMQLQIGDAERAAILGGNAARELAAVSSVEDDSPPSAEFGGS